MLTVNEIKQLIDAFSAEFTTKSELDQMENRIDQKNDNVMTKLDAVYTEVIAVRQEQAGHQVQHQDMERLN